MRKMPVVQAWSAVHAVRPARVLLAMVALVSLCGSQVTVSGVGLFLFDSPVSLLLLLPALAGMGAAIATDNTARLPLPDPPRSVLARAGWVTAWTCLAVLAANVAQVTGPEVTWQPTARNVLLHTALSLVTLHYVHAHAVWLPSLALTLCSMLFGYRVGEPGHYWWAVIMDLEVTPTQWVVTGVLFTAAALAYVVFPAVRRPSWG
ncbi:hypothetical protein ACIF9R_02120 [Streptomyces sp. NPDC086080]|uniref:hypothetical protein n=1 Tax=Streptomyces sp. NPDC086080 TaxID=3365748 RepID=UPI0037D94E43